MLVVISPAKRLDWDGSRPGETTPEFLKEANRLAGHARQLTLGRLKGLMGLSDDLARLNRDRFRVFSDAPASDATRAAAYAFAGDTYLGFEAATLEPDTLHYAQERLRILSGLYGLLRPLDAIQPYRLEMGSRLKTRRGETLYDFWGDVLARELNKTAASLGTDLLINCASKEYFGAVSKSALKLRVITPQFLEEKDGEAKMVSFFAKRARGAMARHLMETRAVDIGSILAFEAGGYRYDPTRSDAERPVFVRAAASEAA